MTERELEHAIEYLKQWNLDEYTKGVHLWFHINYGGWVADALLAEFRVQQRDTEQVKKVCTKLSFPNVHVHYGDNHTFLECWITNAGAGPRELVLEFADRHFFLKIAQRLFDWFLEDKDNTNSTPAWRHWELTAEKRIREALTNAER